MDIYPSNSHESKRASEDKKREPLESVVTGKVTRQKASIGKKFFSTFIGGDARTVVGYIVFEVLLPAARDMIVNAGQEAIHRMVHGESQDRYNRYPSRTSGPTNYNNRYPVRGSSTAPWNKREEPRTISSRARAEHNFDEIIIEERVEAERVLDKLYDLVSHYGEVSVADFYQLAGISGEYTANGYGWLDLRGTQVRRYRHGFILTLPEPMPLRR